MYNNKNPPSRKLVNKAVQVDIKTNLGIEDYLLIYNFQC